MKYRCPHCSNVLANTVNQPMPKERSLGTVHVGYGHYVEQAATERVMGECPMHGVVITEKVEVKG